MPSQPLDSKSVSGPEVALPSVTPLPAPTAALPGPVEPRRSRRGLWVAIVIVVAAAIGYSLYRKQQDVAKIAAASVIRTATVQVRPLEKTLRLTGVTTAEKFSSLIAPSMRGGRGSGGGGGGIGGSGGGGSNGTLQSNSGGNSSGSSSSSSSSSSSATSGTVLASTSSASGGGGGSPASGSGETLASTAGTNSQSLRSAKSASGQRSSGGGGTRASLPFTSGASGGSLGSTASSLPGGGSGGTGRGGGSGDFSLMLQQLVPNGSHVKKGDQLAEFDRQYMLLRLDDFKAGVIQDEADFRKQRAEIELRRKSYDQQILAAKNTVDKAELDIKTIPVLGNIDAERLRLALEEAKARLKQLQSEVKYVDIGAAAQTKSAQLDLQQSKLELRRAEVNADKMLLKAPMDGLAVVQNTFRGGEFGPIQQGDQVHPGMLFMQVVDPSSMVVSATVNQVDVQEMRIGQKALVHFDAFPGLTLPAHLVMIGAITKPGGMRAQYKKDVPVHFKLDKMDPRVIPDLSVSADVLLGDSEKAAVVPLEALIPASKDAEGSQMTAWVRGPEGKWNRREVQVGMTTFTHAAIRSGLREGEVVALESPTAVPEGKEPKRG